ncbi:MAG: sortase [Rubrobacteraceae bacterium]|nr:sortase [Rubrobacteraceae bacterium]MBA3616955.1 sortase [Rubrobacteraceae bacterium]MDQ3436240.1 class E sortase [Actinomycetota bacterium]
MRTYRTRISGLRVLGYLVAALLVVSGLVLVGYSFLIRDPFAGAAVFSQKPPGNSTMTLTVPEMRRVDRVPVYNGAWNDKGALHDGTLHLEDTGFPWQTGANVYIAGHRMGFPGTRSYLVFWDLDTLEAGDKVVLTDANGTRYTYSVFKSIIIGPDDSYITRPIPGKSIISLQTCTLPDYSQRLIVQAELTDVR